jgi:hypothetical protein
MNLRENLGVSEETMPNALEGLHAAKAKVGGNRGGSPRE